MTKTQKMKVKETGKELKIIKSSYATKTFQYANQERSCREYGGKTYKH